MFRIKSRNRNDFRKKAAPVDAQGDYYQWVDNIANEVIDNMQYLNIEYEKALADTLDYLNPQLMDFQISAWVLSSSMNKDAYLKLGNFRQRGLNLYSSAQETMMTMALYAIEKDVEDILKGEYNVEQFGGKTEQTPLQEIYEQGQPVGGSDTVRMENQTRPMRIPQ